MIILANRYQKRPSEILNIDNDYLSYMFDEMALCLEAEATDSKGKTNWNRIKWQTEKPQNNNKELIEFIEKNK